MTAPRPLSRWNWALAAAAIVLIGMTCMPPPALGQGVPPERGAPPAEAAATEQVQSLSDSAEAMSAVGPTQLLEITSEKLVLATARKPLVIQLADKTVVAMDRNGNEISVTEITPGMYVTVLRRASGVTIIVVPKQEAKDGKVQ